jgi:hypothetical protein
LRGKVNDACAGKQEQNQRRTDVTLKYRKRIAPFHISIPSPCGLPPGGPAQWPVRIRMVKTIFALAISALMMSVKRGRQFTPAVSRSPIDCYRRGRKRTAFYSGQVAPVEKSLNSHPHNAGAGVRTDVGRNVLFSCSRARSRI